MHNWETKDPYLTAWVRLRQASDAALRATEIDLGKRQTTLAQMDVLLILSMSKVPLSPGEISAYVFREKHSVSALLSRMERAGYVKKVRSKKDQRVVKIQIQPKGRELLNQSVAVIIGYARDLLRSRFSEKEIRQLDKSMKSPVAYEYVQLNIDEPQEDGSLKKLEVLGQVKAITSKHPFYDERTTPGAAWKQRELGAGDELIQVIATAKILGYVNIEGDRSEVKRPRSPPMPGTQVYKASDELVKKLFKLGKEEIPLNVGYLLHRKNISIPISGKELHRHTAILVLTRYGKSYFAGRIIEQLLKQGATILVIDVNGDYANMIFSPDNTPHPFFKERVTVYRPRSAWKNEWIREVTKSLMVMYSLVMSP